MHFLIAIIAMLCASCVLAASTYILTFVAAALIYGRRSGEELPQPDTVSFLVIVPAHNEAAGIQPTLTSILQCRYTLGMLQLVTIADNCSDDTAKVAGESGSEVWSRTDPQNPGKGQALQWALERAGGRRFDLVAIIDADTIVDPDYFSIMARAYEKDLIDSRAAVYQGRYTFLWAKGKSQWFETFSLASKAAENAFIYRPRAALGLVNLLQGNGFCISRLALERAPFRANSIVEDAEYAVALAVKGVPVRFIEGAQVFSRMTESISDASSQRLRWASGFFRLMFVSVWRLAIAGIRQRSPKLVEAAILLVTTSRVLLVSMTAVALALSLLVARQMSNLLPLELTGIAILLQAVYLWFMFRKSDTVAFPLRDLVWMPFYILLISFAQAMALVGMRSRRWTRTVR